jgi:hypothetical protein
MEPSTGLAELELRCSDAPASLGRSVTPVPERVNRCVDCGKRIKAPSLRCRVHAAAQARRVMQLLRESRGRRPQTSVEVERAILRLGLRLASEFASPVDARPRAAFFRVDQDTVIPVIELSGGNWARGRSFPLAEHPAFAEIVATGKPRANRVRSRPLGPKVSQIFARKGVSAGAGVPITRGGSLQGILAIGLQGPELPDEVFRSLIDLGRLLEFALAG